MRDALKLELINAGYVGVNGRMDFDLSELIAACGEGFSVLGRELDGTFQAYGYTPLHEIGGGSTPEEAVSRLWLALNRKV